MDAPAFHTATEWIFIPAAYGIVLPFAHHDRFWTAEARDRLCAEALERCGEALEGRPLRVLSRDPRLLAQAGGRAAVEFGGWSVAAGRHVSAPPGFDE